MPNIKPFKTLSEHDVVNYFAWNWEDGQADYGQKGTFVKIVGDGFLATNDANAMLGPVGKEYAGIVSERFGVNNRVERSASGEMPLGIMLYDTREFDENGEKLIFNPRKSHEMQCVNSGQPVPIATRGVFLYEGVLGTPVAGAPAYSAGDGLVSANGLPTHKIGTFLGKKDANDRVLLKVEIV